MRKDIFLELVRPPGFGPGLSAWEADVLARLDYGRSRSCRDFVAYLRNRSYKISSDRAAFSRLGRRQAISL